MVEIAVTNKKQQERESDIIRELLGELRKRKGEEDEARNQIEDMQRNLDEFQEKSHEMQRTLKSIL